MTIYEYQWVLNLEHQSDYSCSYETACMFNKPKADEKNNRKWGGVGNLGLVESVLQHTFKICYYFHIVRELRYIMSDRTSACGTLI